MRWIELDALLYAMSLVLAGNAVFCLAAWLLPPVVTATVVALLGCTTVAWVLSSK